MSNLRSFLMIPMYNKSTGSISFWAKLSNRIYSPAATRPARNRMRDYEAKLEYDGEGGAQRCRDAVGVTLSSQRRADDNGGAIPAKSTSRTVNSNCNSERESGAPSRKVE